MAEFEELRLSVVLTDNATAGLTAIRQQITLLTQTGNQATAALVQTSKALEGVGSSSTRTTPAVRSVDAEIKKLTRSTEETTRGLLQMGLASMQGARSLPQLALGARQAWTGLTGMGEAMEAVGVSSRIAVLRLGGVVLGVAAVGAAVVAYGVSVFKFSREMKELSDTAKLMGSSLGELKNAQEHARGFGIAAETIVQSFASIQKAQVDLVQSGSPLRRQLLAIGTPMDVINQLANAPDQRTFQNIAVEYAKRIEQGFLREGKTKSVARGFANKWLEDNFGLSGRLIDMRPIPPMDPKTAAQWREIEGQTKKVSDIWEEINKKLERFKIALLLPGMPALVAWLETADKVMGSMAHWAEEIAKWWAKLPAWMTDDVMGKIVGAMRGAGVPEGPAAPPVPPTQDRLQRMNYTPGASSPLFQRASLELVDETEKNTTETKALTEQLAKLNAFFDRMSAGSTTASAGGPPGVVKASFGGGNAAGAAGVPWAGGNQLGGSRTSVSDPMGRTGAAAAGGQASDDLSKDAYDKMFKGTPLEGHYDNVVAAAKANNVPPSLMAGIIAHETGKGTSSMLRNKNNPAGLMDPKTGSSTGLSFPSIEEGIAAAGKTIGKNYARGGGTIGGMAKSYAPPGAANDPGGLNAGWPGGVASQQRKLAKSVEGGGAAASEFPGGGAAGASSDQASRPERISGQVSVGGKTFDYASGGAGRGSIPFGSFPINIGKGDIGPIGQRIGSLATVGGLGGVINDPKFPGAPRGGIQIHPGSGATLDQLYTQGCFGVPRAQWPAFKASLLEQASKYPSGLMLNIGRTGMASVTPTFPGRLAVGEDVPLPRSAPDRGTLDRGPIDRSNAGTVNSTGKLNIDVNAPAGTKTNYEGTNLLKNYAMQRQTQMLPTSYGQADSPNLWE